MFHQELRIKILEMQLAYLKMIDKYSIEVVALRGILEKVEEAAANLDLGAEYRQDFHHIAMEAVQAFKELKNDKKSI